MDRQQKLEAILEKLSENDFVVGNSENDVQSYCKQICEVYEDDQFHHRYSRITVLLYGSFAPQNEEGLRSVSIRVDRLANNLGMLKDYIDEASREHAGNEESARLIVAKFEKLCDHVDLENARLILLETPYRFTEYVDRELERVTIAAAELKDDVSELDENAEAIEKRLDESQRDYIAILAIFAAVIMAFSGSLSYLTESMAGLSQVPLSSLICASSLVGLLLLNLFYILFRFVWSIIRRSEEPIGIPYTRAALVLGNAVLLLLCGGSFLYSSGILSAFV